MSNSENERIERLVREIGKEIMARYKLDRVELEIPEEVNAWIGNSLAVADCYEDGLDEVGDEGMVVTGDQMREIVASLRTLASFLVASHYVILVETNARLEAERVAFDAVERAPETH